MSIRRFWSAPKTQGDVNGVTEELKNLYYKRLLPIEKHYSFHHFHSPSYEDADFDNKPMVLVMGEYSTGKTTFIRYDSQLRVCLKPQEWYLWWFTLCVFLGIS